MWLYVPSTDSPSALEGEGLNSASDLCSEAVTAASATWRGKLLPPRRWSQIWKQGGWIRLLSGMTLRPSQATSLVDSWVESTSSQAESHANPSARPANGAGQPTTAIYGPKPSESPKKSNRTTDAKPIVSLRTFREWQTSLWTGTSSGPSSRDYRRWATALNRDFSRRTKSAQRMHANGFSSWPTARVSRGEYHYHNGTPRVTLSLEGVAQRQPWPTPRASMAENGNDQGQSSETTAAMWATPSVGDAESGQSRPSINARHAGGDKRLRVDAALWATPTAHDTERDSPNAKAIKGRLKHQGPRWATPSAREVKGAYKSHALTRRDGKSRMDLLGNQAVYQNTRHTPTTGDGRQSLMPDPTWHQRYRASITSTSGGDPEIYRYWSERAYSRGWAGEGERSFFRRALNPTFVEWLMSWPEGWLDATGSPSWATELSHLSPRTPSRFFTQS